jgi:Tol biopolymer transport system component
MKLTLIAAAIMIPSLCFSQSIIFEKDIISTDDVFATAFSPDGKELFFVKSFGGRVKLQLWSSKKSANNEWQSPIPVFSDLSHRDIDPFVMPDGSILFNSDRPLAGKPAKRFHIWQVKKSDSGWDKPQPLMIVNSDSSDFYATADERGNLYFTSGRSGAFRTTAIWYSPKVAGQLTAPILLDSVVNASGTESNPFISPKADYLVFLRSDDKGEGDSDLYITFRQKTGSWSTPVNLGKMINTPHAEFAPYVSRDGKQFYFSRIVRGVPLIENIYVYKDFDKLIRSLK